MYDKLLKETQDIIKEDLYTPSSKPQKVFKQLVDAFGAESDKMMGHQPGDKYSAVHGLMYAFHDPNSVATDADLYDIMLGQADYNYGTELKAKIDAAMEKLGYYMEYQGQGVWNFVKN